MLDPNLNPDLRYRVLEAPFIIKDYVAGEKRCNYELYLTELLNNSKWIGNHHNCHFEYQKAQSSGECDAYSDDYGIDFKLIASKTQLQARSILSFRIEKITDGMILKSAQGEDKTVQITRLKSALRGKGLEELEAIRKNKSKKYGIENDLKTFLNTLEIDKNLLLFYPFVFFFEKDDYSNGDKIVVESLQYDFGQALLYRNQKVHNKETLFITIYKEDFLLMDVKDNKLVLVETIPTSKCETFEYLKTYSDFWR